MNLESFLKKTPEEQLDILNWIVGLSDDFQITKEFFLVKMLGNKKFPCHLVKKIYQEKLWGITPDTLCKINTLTGMTISIPIYCYAAVRSDLDRAKTIIKFGADLNKKFHDIYTKTEISPLEYIFAQSPNLGGDFPKIIQLFMDYGANPNQIVNYNANDDNLLTFLSTIIKDEYQLERENPNYEVSSNLVKGINILLINGCNPSHINKNVQTYVDIIPYAVKSKLNLKRLIKINYKTSNKCVICQENFPKVACNPCGHICICMECLLNDFNKSDSCPLCRGYTHNYQIIDIKHFNNLSMSAEQSDITIITDNSGSYKEDESIYN
jgi:hypothetical protein